MIGNASLTPFHAPGKSQIDSEDTVEKRIERAVEFIKNLSYGDAEEILLDIVKNERAGKEKASFLLGRLYTIKGDIEKAEEYLKSAADNYPLLRDYALKLLVDVYITSEQFGKVIKTARQINNRVLLQGAKGFLIDSLLALKKEEEAIKALFRYIKEYPEDWDYKLSLAKLLRDKGATHKAVHLFKDIYIHAVPLSEDALRELKAVKSDSFTKEEILKRADNLFEKHDYQEAETAYEKVLTIADNKEKHKIRFLIGMSQFRQKRYDASAKNFGFINTPKAMYWQARSFYRFSNMDGFKMVQKRLENLYPHNKYLALLFLMEAEELVRRGELSNATETYKKVSNQFPKNTEDALWGIGWMHYTSGDYGAALNYFSKLTAYLKSKNYYKYLYWKAKTKEKLFEDCIKQKVNREHKNNKDMCNKEDDDYFSRLPSDKSYYGYLIKLNSQTHALPEKIEIVKPARPEGKTYERIEDLAFLGMRDDVVNEIVDSLKSSRKRGEFAYLGYMAMKWDEYREIIAFAEEKEDREFLPYSYPLGYWDVVKEAADSQNLDAHLVTALIREESRFDPKAISWAGAVGLMQLIPSTAYRLQDGMKVNLKDSAELQEPRKNIILGTHYLSQLINEFKDIPLAIAAYNAGEHTLKNWLSRFNKNDIIEFIENIPYRETRKYVKRVLKSYWQYKAINGLPINGPPSICNVKC